MSNYTKTVDFASKDTLPSGDSGKIIKGTEFETEFDNIATAVATKADSAAPTFTGTSVFANLDISGDIDVDGTTNLDVVDIDGAVDMATTLAVAGNVDFNGDLDVDGTTNLDVVDIDGAVDFASTTAHAGNATFADNAKAIFGAGSDLQIHHNGSRSTILDSGTGALRIAGTNLEFMNAAESKFYANASDGGAFNLYYDNAVKLATTSTGINVTGTASVDGLTVAGVAYIQSTTTPQLELAYNSGNITGFYRSGGDFQIKNDNGAGTPETSIVLAEDGAVTLYHDASAKLDTTATGIDVTGVITTDGMTTSADINFGDSDKAVFGAGSDLEIYHDGSHSYVSDQGTGNLRILAQNFTVRNSANNESMLIATPDAGVTLYHDNAAKLATTATGIDVTGVVEATGYLAVEGTSGNTGAAGDRWIGGDGTAGTWFYNVPTGSNHYFGVNNANKLAINSSGIDVTGSVTADGGTGTATSGGTLIVKQKGDTNADGIALTSSHAVSHRVWKDAGGNLNIGSSSYPSAFVQDFTGNVDIAGTATMDALTVTGTLFVNVTTEVASGYIASIKCAAGTGGVIIQNSSTTGVPLSFRDTSGSQIGSVSTTNTATAYNTSSDQRLKDNIADADDAGSKVDSIQVRKFDWKADGSHQDYGMVAQELLEVAPEAVHQPQDSEEMMGVDYSKLVPMLVKEIQQLRQRVAHLEE